MRKRDFYPFDNVTLMRERGEDGAPNSSYSVRGERQGGKRWSAAQWGHQHPR